MKPVDVYIALGSNQGDRVGTIIQALTLLEENPGVTVCLVSQMIETEPEGGPPDQTNFLNAAARLQCTLDAETLLKWLQEVEARLGRVRVEKWGPRTIDLDILLYGQNIIDQPHLQVPHPLMHQRSFVLRPLMEIAPRVVHPVLKKNIRQLAQLLED